MLANPAPPPAPTEAHPPVHTAGWCPGGEGAGTDGLLDPDTLSSVWPLLMGQSVWEVFPNTCLTCVKMPVWMLGGICPPRPGKQG